MVKCRTVRIKPKFSRSLQQPQGTPGRAPRDPEETPGHPRDTLRSSAGVRASTAVGCQTLAEKEDGFSRLAPELPTAVRCQTLAEKEDRERSEAEEEEERARDRERNAKSEKEGEEVEELKK
ncbi:hypothetical protein L484_009447 [Morus notabilis]|uniref:Uncharacterized protein n=1 Tax=Morus notabilis TaxID=981085 RepID=W9RWF9_9ROSA|nr:hypothetical protein L484_009447 [Morus notabilis]